MAEEKRELAGDPRFVMEASEPVVKGTQSWPRFTKGSEAVYKQTPQGPNRKGLDEWTRLRTSRDKFLYGWELWAQSFLAAKAKRNVTPV